MQKQKIALIHGYGIGIKPTLFTTCNALDAGFESFSSLIKRKKAVAFRWDIPKSLTLLQSFNPYKQLCIYKKELKKALQKETQKKLYNFLTHEKPSIVVCHSLGAKLLMQSINAYGLPETPTNIVFVQADIPSDFPITDKETIEKLEKKSLRIWNFYCVWDPALLASFFLSKTVPAGLIGSSNKYVTNKFFPLYKRINLHRSSICDGNFVKEIKHLTTNSSL